ncbi:MAG: nicotinate-nucleotide adenylyltransferase [Plesiomonas sp.]|uniref:nicotinate-nucleotide adenylyltransferase n=1 Tax=Plesiomonas sp. TaxID=2486279 RepID=UPI003F2F78CC
MIASTYPINSNNSNTCYIPTPSSLIGLYGGTFDPIHRGHIESVSALATEVGLTQIRLMPNNVPPHRPQPHANAQQRADMVALVCQHYPLFVPDLRELERNTPSYTINTLEDIRREIGSEQPLAFIIGQDSLLSLPTWHRWQSLLQVAHLIVCMRPHYPRFPHDPHFQQWIAQHRTTQSYYLHRYPQGALYFAYTPLIDISATDIRAQLQQGNQCDQQLTTCVAHYIRQNRLYSSA